MLQLANDAIFISENHNKHLANSAVHVLQPITALIPFYSVDRNFNAVITGSHKLQRAMFAQQDFMTNRIEEARLKPSDYSSINEMFHTFNQLPIKPLNSLFWLIEKKLGHGALGFATKEDRIILYFNAFSPRYRAKHKKLMTSAFGTQNASWRRIQVFQSDVKKERLEMVMVSYCPLGRDNAERLGSYHETLDFKDGTPLGEIFEKLVGITLRTQAQHVAAEHAYKLRKVA